MKEDNENKVLQHEQEKLFEIKIAIIQGADVLHDIGKALEDARNKKKASIKKQGDKKKSQGRKDMDQIQSNSQNYARDSKAEP